MHKLSKYRLITASKLAYIPSTDSTKISAYLSSESLNFWWSPADLPRVTRGIYKY